MGTDKSNLKHKSGKTYLQYSCERLASVCDDVVVSGNQPLSNYEVIVDSVADRGPAAGVAASLGYARTHEYNACYVTPVDMPDLSIKDLHAVKQKWLSHPQSLVCVVSKSDGQLQPLVAIYPVAFLDDLKELSQSQNRSLHHWLQARPYVPAELSSESCRNVNRPEDL